MLFTDPSDIAARFGDVGTIAGQAIAAPHSISSSAKSASIQARCAARRCFHSLIAFFAGMLVWLVVGGALGALLAALTLTLLINRALNYVDASHRAQLLQPLSNTSDDYTVVAHCVDKGSAHQWLTMARNSGRQLRRFDLEIMSMLEEHDALAGKRR